MGNVAAARLQREVTPPIPGTNEIKSEQRLKEQTALAAKTIQAALAGHNRLKYSKRDIAFRGLMTCSHDGCMLTGEVPEKVRLLRLPGHLG